MQKLLYSLLLTTALLQADGFYNSQSFQGFTGIINTPNAEVIEEGKVAFEVSNQNVIIVIRLKLRFYHQKI